MSCDPVVVTPYTIAEAYRAHVVEALRVAGSEPITTSYVDVGTPVDDDVCGQLIVSVGRLYRTQRPPAEDLEPERCFVGKTGFPVTVRLTRCVAVISEHGAPTGQVLAADAERIYADQATMWDALNGDLPAGVVADRTSLGMSIEGPLGQAIAVVGTFHLAINSATWAGAPPVAA